MVGAGGYPEPHHSQQIRKSVLYGGAQSGWMWVPVMMESSKVGTSLRAVWTVWTLIADLTKP